MEAGRIRQVNVFELDQAMYNSTYRIGLELAEWFNASMHICMLETNEQKEFYSALGGEFGKKAHDLNRNQIQDIIDNVKVKGDLLDLGYSMNHFHEDESIQKIFSELSVDESLSILGYNKSEKHKQVLKKLLDFDLGSPLMLIPMNKEMELFHKLIVPFEPEYVTKEKLAKLKWYTDQLGVMVDFVHFKKKSKKEDLVKLKLTYDNLFKWIDELKFSSAVNFRIPSVNKLHEGLSEFLKDQKNYILCVLDDEIKKFISTSSGNSKCIMDIKETLVII